MGSVQQNGEKSIGVFSLAYQLLQAVNQSTYSVGINPLLLYIWTHSISVCSTKACEILQWCPFSPYRISYCRISVHPVRKYKSPNRSEFNTWSAVASAADRPLLTPRVTAKLKLMAVAGQNWYKCWDFSIHQGDGWYIFDVVVLIIMVKTMFFVHLCCEYWTKRHIFGLIASP